MTLSIIYLFIGVVIVASNLAQITDTLLNMRAPTIGFLFALFAIVLFWLPVTLYAYHKELNNGS